MNSLKTPNKQRGAVLVLTALSLFVLMGMAGLAIDIGHTIVNKTITQNAADALAMSAAIRLNQHNDSDTNIDELAAVEYGKTTYDLFQSAPGNGEISDELTRDDFTYTFANVTDLSTTTDWHTADAADEDTGALLSTNTNFVRVTTDTMNVNAWFAGVVGIPQLSVSSSAVAGTTPLVPCDVAPVLMCADTEGPLEDPVAKDSICDGSDGNNRCYGYTLDNLYCMVATLNEAGAGSPSPVQCNQPPYGPGNIGLINLNQMFPDLDVKGGAATIKECLAGEPDCKNLCESESPDEAITDPGLKWGGVNPGIESLFNKDNPELKSSEKEPYPSDTVTGYGTLAGESTSSTILTANAIATKVGGSPAIIPTAGIPLASFSPNPYQEYLDFTNIDGQDSNASLDQNGNPNAVDKKRILSIPFVDCRNWEEEGDENGGVAHLPIVGYGCFWVAGPLERNASKAYLFGAFVGDRVCNAAGESSANKDYGIDKVILYKDPLGGHS